MYVLYIFMHVHPPWCRYFKYMYIVNQPALSKNARRVFPFAYVLYIYHTLHVNAQHPRSMQ